MLISWNEEDLAIFSRATVIFGGFIEYYVLIWFDVWTIQLQID